MSHRFIKFYLGAMLWLSAAPAFGQVPFFPFDLPPRSVIANPTGGSAPASAMSFDQLRSSLMLPPDGPVQIVPNGTIWGNISGGMGLASFYGISPVLDSLLGTTQGSVVYRNATGWVSLPPGVLGQLLSTGGGGANPSWITANGTGTVTSVTCGTGLTGGTFSTIGTCALALTNATLQANPSSPAGTTSSTGAMMGMGSTCKITLVYGTRVRFEIQGYVSNNTSGDTTTAKLYFGTGLAPVNSVAFTGTQIGNSAQGTSGVSNSATPINMSGLVTGLSVGTAYWFDIDLLVNGGTGSFNTPSCNAMEF